MGPWERATLLQVPLLRHPLDGSLYYNEKESELVVSGVLKQMLAERVKLRREVEREHNSR